MRLIFKIKDLGLSKRIFFTSPKPISSITQFLTTSLTGSSSSICRSL